jgi:hypothetical protein
MMYCTFATLFIAQAYNVELSLAPADHDAADSVGYIKESPACCELSS